MRRRVYLLVTVETMDDESMGSDDLADHVRTAVADAVMLGAPDSRVVFFDPASGGESGYSHALRTRCVRTVGE